MAVIKTPLDMVQGETFQYPVTIYEVPDLTANPLPTPTLKDLTGCDAHMQIRTAPGAPILVDAKSGSGITIDLANSEVLINLSGDMTANLSVPTARYDLWLLTPDGKRLPILMGPVTIELSITSPVTN